MTSTRQVARAASLVMVFFALSRLLGLFREIVIAGQFGTSPEMDAYLAAFRLPDFLFNLVSGGALASAFLPTFAGRLHRPEGGDAWRLASAILNWTLLIVLTLGLVVIWLAPLVVDKALAPGFTPAQKVLTASLMRSLMVSTVLFSVSGLFMAILNAQQRFLLPAIAPLVYNLALIAGAWFLGPVWGVYGLVAGVVAGAAGHLLVQLPGLWQSGMRYQWTLAPTDAGVREVMRLMGPRLLGLAALQFSFWWDAYLASSLPAGSYTALNYGRLLMLLPQGIIAQAVASAAFPTLSILAAQEDWPALQRILTATLRGVLYLTVPAMVGLLVLAGPIITVLFQRKNFDATSVNLTMWALSFYGLGLVAHSVVEILTRAFYALHNTKIPVVVGLVVMGLNIGLSLLLRGWFQRQGWPAHGGIAFASSLAVILEMVWLGWALRRLPGRLTLAGLWPAVGRMMAAALVMAGVLAGYRFYWAAASPWLVLLGGIGLGGAVYLAMVIALGGLDELRHLRR